MVKTSSDTTRDATVPAAMIPSDPTGVAAIPADPTSEVAVPSDAMTGGTGNGEIAFKLAMGLMIIGLIAHAFTPLWTKLSNFDPGTSAFLRCGIALLVLAPLAFREYKKIGAVNRTGVNLALFSGIFLGVDFLCYNYSIFYAGAGIAAILLNIQIIILPLLALVFDGEKPSKAFWFFIPVMFVALAATGGIFDSNDAGSGPATVYGINTALLGTVLGAASGTMYGFYLYFSRKSGRLNPGAFVQVMFWSVAAQLIPIAIWTFLIGPRGWDISHGVNIAGKLPMKPETTLGDAITLENWLWMILLAVVGQAMCWLFIQIGSVNLSPSLAATMLLLSPVASVILAGTLLGEQPSMLQYVGIVVVLSCVAYLNRVFQSVLGLFNKKPTPTATT